MIQAVSCNSEYGKAGNAICSMDRGERLYRPAAVVVTLYSINYSPPNPHYVIAGI